MTPKRFASKTSVPAERTRAEIEQTLFRYGAREFGFTSSPAQATIMFKAHERFVRFTIRLLQRDEHGVYRRPWDGKTVDHRGKPVFRAVRDKDAEQEVRQMWRALLLVVKAKLEAVASGITTFESEFLAHIVMPPDKDGRVNTVGEVLIPRIGEWYADGKMPPLLGLGGS